MHSNAVWVIQRGLQHVEASASKLVLDIKIVRHLGDPVDVFLEDVDGPWNVIALDDG